MLESNTSQSIKYLGGEDKNYCSLFIKKIINHATVTVSIRKNSSIFKMYSTPKFYKRSRLSKFSYIVQKDERRLRCAASRNDSDRLNELLKDGVNPNACDENGRTALHLASASGYSSVVKLLLKYRADCNVVDKLGNTPLHLAVCTTSTATINLLLNAGCSAFQKGHNGCTPLQLAQTKLKLLQKYCSPDYSELKSKISEIIDKMKVLLEDEAQEMKLSELFSSGLLLNEDSDLTTDISEIIDKMKVLLEDEAQEMKLSELFSSGLLLNEDSYLLKNLETVLK